jgi:hypothetical protein
MSVFQQLLSRWGWQRKPPPAVPWRILPSLPANGWSTLSSDEIERYLYWHVITSSPADKHVGAYWAMEPEWQRRLLALDPQAEIDLGETNAFLLGLPVIPRFGAGAPHLEAR